MRYPSYRSRFFWVVEDPAKLDRSIDEVFASLKVDFGLFASDNLVTWGRNLGFLDDMPLIAAWQKHAGKVHERGILWRTATLAWAARQGLRREGAFIECGCYAGTTAHILLDALQITRPFYLYDRFETADRAMPEHGGELYGRVQARFADYPNVVITKGSIPDTLTNAPDQIAFMHIDMNSAAPEIAALDVLFDRVVPGGVVVFDDYGTTSYRDQFLAERAWFAKRGISVLELPTGQGMVVA